MGYRDASDEGKRGKEVTKRGKGRRVGELEVSLEVVPGQAVCGELQRNRVPKLQEGLTGEKKYICSALDAIGEKKEVKGNHGSESGRRNLTQAYLRLKEEDISTKKTEEKERGTSNACRRCSGGGRNDQRITVVGKGESLSNPRLQGRLRAKKENPGNQEGS